MIKDWNRENLTGQVFHFKNSLRPFIEIKNYAWDSHFLDLGEGIFYTIDELDSQGLFFYSNDNDEDFMGVDVVGIVGW